MNNSIDYTNKGFDPNSLKAPELRSILIKHGINYNSNAKKDELVNVFKKNLKSGKIKPDLPPSKRTPIKPNTLLDTLTSPIPNNNTPALKGENSVSKTGSPMRKTITPIQSPERRSSRNAPKNIPNDQSSSSNSPLTKTELNSSKTPAKKDNKPAQNTFSEENPFQAEPGTEKKRARADDVEEQSKKPKKKKKSKKKKAKDVAPDSEMAPQKDMEIENTTSTDKKSEASQLNKKKEISMEIDNPISDPAHSIKNNDAKPEISKPTSAVDQKSTPIAHTKFESSDSAAKKSILSPKKDPTPIAIATTFPENSILSPKKGQHHSTSTLPESYTLSPKKDIFPTIGSPYRNQHPITPTYFSPKSRSSNDPLAGYPPSNHSQLSSSNNSNQKVSELVAYYEHTRPVEKSSMSSLQNSPNKPSNILPPLSGASQLRSRGYSFMEQDPFAENSYLSSSNYSIRNRRVSEVDESHIYKSQQNYKKTLEFRSRRNSAISENKLTTNGPINKQETGKVEINPLKSEEKPYHIPKKTSINFRNMFLKAFILSSIVLFSAYTWRNYMFHKAGYLQTRHDSEIISDNVFDLPSENDSILSKLYKYSTYYYSKNVGPIGFTCPAHATCYKNIEIPYTFNPTGLRDSIFSNSENDAGQNKIVLQCDTSYIVHYPIKVFSNTLLAPPVCVRDLSTETRIQELISAILRTLKMHRGVRECGQSMESLSKILIKKLRSLSLDSIFSPPKFSEWELVSKAYKFDSDDPDVIELLGINADKIKALVKETVFMPESEFEYLFSKAKEAIKNDLSLGVHFFNLEVEPTSTEDESLVVDGEAVASSPEKLELYLVSSGYDMPIVSRIRFVDFLYWGKVYNA
ncbi:Inner nuclear membrane protein SRC1 [Smittium culicis]|uniref:Inner nuclear membrane protein SRC1 n=1 Tax=Smittium culicis TaxID=133412 RepID=A0A1R1YQN2_9FUNG|nr:Inner nuclear membrane protein SRC1 [Smittium culicis]